MKKLLLLAVCCIGLSNANAQSGFTKKLAKAEKKDASFTMKEVKKAAKEYAEMISEDAEEVFKVRKDFEEKSLKKKEKFMMEEFEVDVIQRRADRYKVADNLPSLENQIETDVRTKWSFDEDLFPTYISGEAKCLAKIIHEITMQFSKKDFVKRFGYVKAQEMVQATLDTKNGIQERIGDVMKVIELYNSKNTVSSEVFVRVYYNGIQAKEDFKNALKDLLKNDATLYNEMTYFLESAKAK